MSRRGVDARARDRRHRAAGALRSQSSARAAARANPAALPASTTGNKDAPSVERGSTKHAATRGLAPVERPKRTTRRVADVDLDPLRQLVVGRDAAALLPRSGGCDCSVRRWVRRWLARAGALASGTGERRGRTLGSG
jgi:hypothetical protein